MTKYYDKWATWRDRIWDRVYDIMGDRCYICGYNKCRAALEFHHIDPTEKNFIIGNLGRGSIKWETLLDELRKCVILCSNCHREYHNGKHDIELTSTFDESKIHNHLTKCMLDGCTNKVKTIRAKYCSTNCSKIAISQQNRKDSECARKMAENKRIWENTNVIELIERHNGNMCSAAREVNMSDNAVRKRLKKVTGFHKYSDYLLAQKAN